MENKDDQVLSIIFMTLYVSLWISFRNHTTAKEMWDYLNKRYTQDSRALGCSLLQNLSNLQQKEETLEEFYTIFTLLMGQLKAHFPKAASGCERCKEKEKHD
uniref:Retrotransposon gag domain-containing protein n=1 Tax=Oryza brachyantha TaxID=4533 RepID=J3M174_ORYBR